MKRSGPFTRGDIMISIPLYIVFAFYNPGGVVLYFKETLTKTHTILYTYT